MKKLLPLFLLFGCKMEKPNLAEVMVKAQQPQATCRSARIGADVAICDIPGKDKIVQFIAVYGKDGFKAYPLTDDKQTQAQPTPPPAAQPTPPAPEAGSGSGANAPTK